MIKSPLTTGVFDFGTKKSNPRTGKIVKITPHHFAGTTGALTQAKAHYNDAYDHSANYYIKDDQIICGVSEDRRAWTSGGAKKNNGMTGKQNDYVAITFEVSNSSTNGNWPISDKSYRSLVRLCADICKRYGITPHYDGTSNGTITTHDMFSATACPGPYLKNLIASHKFENDILVEMGAGMAPAVEPAKDVVFFRVQTGAFKNKANAEGVMTALKEKGFDAYVKKEGQFFKVQVGAFSVKKNAESMLSKLSKAGYTGFITMGGAA